MGSTPKENRGAKQRRPALPRQMIAEVIGTFFLTLAGAGIEIVDVLHPGHIDRTIKAIVPASVVVAMIFSLGDVSGAHLNPAVTGMFAVRGDFEWKRVPAYWAAQVAGATLAAATLRALFGTVRSVGTSEIHLTAWRAYVIEAILTTLLIIVILNTAHEHSIIGSGAAIAVGATLVACGMLGGELTTASLNPARSLGSALISGNFKNLWVFVAGPFTGAVVGLSLVTVIRPRSNEDEHTAAQ